MQFCDASNKLTALNAQVCQQTQTQQHKHKQQRQHGECINRFI